MRLNIGDAARGEVRVRVDRRDVRCEQVRRHDVTPARAVGA